MATNMVAATVKKVAAQVFCEMMSLLCHRDYYDPYDKQMVNTIILAVILMERPSS